jgi:hypothetical protein
MKNMDGVMIPLKYWILPYNKEIKKYSTMLLNFVKITSNLLNMVKVYWKDKD